MMVSSGLKSTKQNVFLPYWNEIFRHYLNEMIQHNKIDVAESKFSGISLSQEILTLWLFILIWNDNKCWSVGISHRMEIPVSNEQQSIINSSSPTQSIRTKSKISCPVSAKGKQCLELFSISWKICCFWILNLCTVLWLSLFVWWQLQISFLLKRLIGKLLDSLSWTVLLLSVP